MKKLSVFLFTLLIFNFLKSQTDSIDVIHYTIELNVDNKISKGHTGKTQIQFNRLTNQYNRVEFSLQNQVVDSIYTGNTQVNIPLKNTQFTLEGNKIIIPIEQTSLSEDFLFIIYYHGASTVENNSVAWGGLHYDNDIIYSMGVAFADYPHSYARSWFACNESFTDKATYDLYISVDKEKEAVCSGNFVEKQEFTDYDTYHYNVPQNISPYLVSMTIGKFYTYRKTIHSNTYNYDIPLTVKYIYQNDSANIVHNFSGLDSAFNCLERHFGRFCFNRIGYCVTPKGSMEHVDNISLARGAVMDTTIDGVSNIVHELGHSWFGNLVTCQTAEDMWLNEGWTTYTTRLSLESIYGKEKTDNYWRNKHRWVLEKLPLEEGNQPVSGVDSTLTYSSTVYEKGSMVAMLLNSLLGDDLFFETVKAMLDSFEYKNINSQMLKDFLLSHCENCNMDRVFDALVFSANNVNYDLTQSISQNDISLNVYSNTTPDKNKTFNCGNFTVSLMDTHFNRKDIVINQSNNENFTHIDNTDNYVKAFLDLDEKLLDCTTRTSGFITTNGLTNYKDAHFKLYTQNITDSIFLQVTHHYGQSDSPYDLPYGVERISGLHYWTIQGVNMDRADLTGRFFYQIKQASNSFDTTLLRDYYSKDSLIMLYRVDKNSNWIYLPTPVTEDYEGDFIIQNLLCGDYTFAVGDREKVALNQINNNHKNISVYPNPSNGTLTLNIKNWKATKVFATSTDGKQSFEIPITDTTTVYRISKAGIYILTFTEGNTKYSTTVIIQ